MLALLAGYVLWAGVRGQDASSDQPALPSEPRELFVATGLHLLMFAGLFAVAWAFGRPSKADLYGAQRVHLGTFAFGLVWSFILRMAVALVLVVILTGVLLARGKGGTEFVQQFRPKVENLFSPGALTNPVYVLLCTTWVSFVVAGLREELWRAGVIAALRALFPAEWPGRRWEWLAVLIAAVLFGLGHLTQGWAAVGLTGVLGFGLGAIMVLRRSLPEAVIAHGFFDAFTFAALAVLANPSLLQRLGVDPNLLNQLLGK
jgi:membrane protease YdiL (CAAX protease family)